VPACLRSSARTPAFALILATLFCPACASGKKPNESWKAEKAYGAKMARQGFWREALFRFEKAAEQKPDDAEIQNDLAVAYESLGDTSHALAAYKRALELAPNDQKIKRNYARFAEYYTSVQRATAPAPSTK
jgi:Flp pilus assembly protein TadD